MKFFGILILFISLSSAAFRLERIQSITLSKEIFKPIPFGGISGMVFKDQKLWMISDDPGRRGSPRLYVFDVALSGNKFQLKESRLVKLESDNPKFFFDGEGLALDGENGFILSSEGNSNSKPRIHPKVVRVDLNGKIQSEIEIPAPYLPEKQGLQKNGISPNAGFEGVTRWGSDLFLAAERPLVQDKKFLSIHPEYEILRWLKYSLASAQPHLEAEYLYPLMKTVVDGRLEYQKGISEILSISSKKFLVLERSLELSPQGIRFDSHLFQAELPLSKSPEARTLLTNEDRKKKNWIIKKELQVFEVKDGQNFEALAWGPGVSGASKTLWIGSDNNFSKDETTILIFKVLED